MASEQAPLPFLVASNRYRERTITWDEYLHQLFSHCVPKWNEELEFRDELKLRREDDFAYSVFSYQDEVLDVEDPRPLEEVFHAYRNAGTAEAVQERLSTLSDATADYVKASVALLALQDRKLPVLRLCLENGKYGFDYRHGHAFEDLANAVNKKQEPELHRMIQDSAWREVNDWRPPGARDERGE